jgi:hypothetical protein
MKTIVKSFILALSLILLLCGMSQNAFSQTPIRQVLFTMSETEALDFGEYAVAASISGNKFAAILRDQETYKCDLVFNGQRVIDDMDDYFSMFTNDEMFIDPLDPNGYSIKFVKDEQIYICMRGIIKGPFEDANLRPGNIYNYKLAGRWYENNNGVVNGPFVGDVPEDKTPSGKYAFCYYEDEQYFANVNGNIIGPFVDYNDITISDNGDYAIIYSYEYGQNYVRVNSRDFGPYTGCYNVVVGANGNYAFSYQDEHYNELVNVNGKVMGPYSSCTLSEINKRGDYSFTYKDDGGSFYTYFNSALFGPYNNCSTMDITDSGKYMFYYINESDECFVNINGVVKGPYFYCSDMLITESGKYAFSYEDEYGNYYIDMNGSIIGPYGWVNSLKLNDDGSYRIQFNDANGITFDNNNGVVTMNKTFQYNYSGFFEMFSDDGEHSFVSSYDYPYVVIDGENYGTACAMSAYYDKDKDSFVWNTIEERQLVAYEFKLK